MKIISVVRDFELYNRLIRHNPNNIGADFFPVDNRAENKSISVRYNEFIKSYDYSKPDWFVFCHEDWEIKEDWQKKILKLDKNCLYGPIGSLFYNFKLFGIRRVFGSIVNSNKDGSEAMSTGIYSFTLKKIDTFDCQCLIVHSSLIDKYKLQFDENLLFDLYVEDFCIAAKEGYNIQSKIIQLECQHYSYGKVGERFWKQLDYLSQKYQHLKKTYFITVKSSYVGKIAPRIILSANKFVLIENRITRSGKHLIKFCKIPIWWKKVR